MPKVRPTTKEGRRAKEPATIPDRFVPKFWELDTDKRQTRLRIIRQCIDELCEHVNADSMQKRILVERAIFMHLQCQTIEIDSYANLGSVDLKRIAVHTQMSNALNGLLSKLKLEKAVLDKVVDLKTILAESRRAK